MKAPRKSKPTATSADALPHQGASSELIRRERLEQQSLRARRLEAIGSLASGLAHDLSNSLLPVQVVIEHLKRQHPDQPRWLEVLAASSKHAADLVRRLVAFAAGGEVEMTRLEIGLVLGEQIKILEQTLPHDIVLEFRCEPELPVVMGNAIELHQVLMNLCLNAQDSMPRGGRLRIEAEVKKLGAPPSAGLAGETARRFLVIQVADTGCGIAPDDLPRIFEPFFTTKEAGEGTGFGLTMVQRIVTRHGGFVTVDSKLGAGSTFAIHLPAATVVVPARSPPPPALRGCGELVLVVDDEEPIVEVVRLLLEDLNFSVLTAANGRAALDLAAQHRDQLKLVITDFTMPGMSGLELVQRLKRADPKLTFFVISGRLDEASQRKFEALDLDAILRKPFTEAALTEALQKVAPKWASRS